MTSRHSFTIANRKPHPSPKIPKLTAREEKLAIEHLRRQIAKLDVTINGPKAAASAPASAPASEAPRASRLPPEEKAELDRKMGLLGKPQCFLRHGGTLLVLGGYPRPGETVEPVAGVKPPGEEMTLIQAGGATVILAGDARPKPPPPEPAAASALPPEEKAELDRKMGLEPRGIRVEETPVKLTFHR